MANGLYSYIKVEFDSLLAGDKDPNTIACPQWHVAVAKALKNFIENRVTVSCAWVGVMPPSSSDPLTADVWPMSVTSFVLPPAVDFNSWIVSIQTLLIANMNISGRGNAGVVLSSSTFPLALPGLVVSQNTLGSKSTINEAWDYIGDCILTWITSSPAAATGAGTHGSYTGTATQISNIST